MDGPGGASGGWVWSTHRLGIRQRMGRLGAFSRPDGSIEGRRDDQMNWPDAEREGGKQLMASKQSRAVTRIGAPGIGMVILMLIGALLPGAVGAQMGRRGVPAPGQQGGAPAPYGGYPAPTYPATPPGGYAAPGGYPPPAYPGYPPPGYGAPTAGYAPGGY